jgi:hypothetical protein
MVLMSTIPCPKCGKSFTRRTAAINRHVAKGIKSYCSRRCANLVNTQKPNPVLRLECPVCKRTYERHKRVIDHLRRKGRTNFYCSKSCAAKAAWKEKPAPKVTLRCAGCRRLFERSPFAAAERRKAGRVLVCCTKACANRARRKPPVILECDRCGKKFKRHGSRVRRAARIGLKHCYCSMECRNNQPKAKGRWATGWRRDSQSTAHCAYCKKKFKIDAGAVRRRMTQSNGRLYCSKVCSSTYNSKHGSVGSQNLKRQKDWDDERWYWEKRLSREGLGVMVGGSGNLVYGEEYDQGAAAARRKAAGY